VLSFINASKFAGTPSSFVGNPPAYPNHDGRVLDTFDWYSPAYQSQHSHPEVYRWFRETGPTDVAIPIRRLQSAASNRR
jgi:hypothetical protein